MYDLLSGLFNRPQIREILFSIDDDARKGRKPEMVRRIIDAMADADIEEKVIWLSCFSTDYLDEWELEEKCDEYDVEASGEPLHKALRIVSKALGASDLGEELVLLNTNDIDEKSIESPSTVSLTDEHRDEDAIYNDLVDGDVFEFAENRNGALAPIHCARSHPMILIPGRGWLGYLRFDAQWSKVNAPENLAILKARTQELHGPDVFEDMLRMHRNTEIAMEVQCRLNQATDERRKAIRLARKTILVHFNADRQAEYHVAYDPHHGIQNAAKSAGLWWAGTRNCWVSKKSITEDQKVDLGEEFEHLEGYLVKDANGPILWCCGIPWDGKCLVCNED